MEKKRDVCIDGYLWMFVFSSLSDTCAFGRTSYDDW